MDHELRNRDEYNMARDLRPRVKIYRRFGENLSDNNNSKALKRNYAPGVHGQKRIRTKMSDYGKQLREKQKARFMYGVLERQFKNTFMRAQKLSGSAGLNLLTLLEKRADNVVYRAGFAETRRLARQLVNHGHFEVNGKKMDIPSYTVRVGDVLKVRTNKLEKKEYWKTALERTKKRETASWVNVDPKAMTITVTAEPTEEELPQNVQTQLIVEFYSR